jgi:hypothetical protein
VDIAAKIGPEDIVDAVLHAPQAALLIKPGRASVLLATIPRQAKALSREVVPQADFVAEAVGENLARRPVEPALGDRGDVEAVDPRMLAE